jgi:site-specific recombinase XerD
MDVNTSLGRLFRRSAPSADEIVLGFRHWMTGAHLSSASINRHLACLRSVSKLGRMLGMMTWYLEVPGVKGEKRRQTAGPTVEDVRRMLAAMSGDTEADTRDAAIVMTFYCLGLRVSELCGLTLQDTNLDRGCTWIKGKGWKERELVPLPQLVITALRQCLTHRGSQAGPLFRTRGNRGHNRDGHLETRSVLRIVRTLGQRVGLHVWCHGLRHTAITTAIREGATGARRLGPDPTLLATRDTRDDVDLPGRPRPRSDATHLGRCRRQHPMRPEANHDLHDTNGRMLGDVQVDDRRSRRQSVSWATGVCRAPSPRLWRRLGFRRCCRL